MTSVGLFEAKTKLSELCEEVARRREPIVITRRGRPFVRIEPIGAGNGGAGSSIWDARDEWDKQHGPPAEDFELPERSPQTWHNPLHD